MTALLKAEIARMQKINMVILNLEKLFTNKVKSKYFEDNSINCSLDSQKLAMNEIDNQISKSFNHYWQNSETKLKNNLNLNVNQIKVFIFFI